MKGGRSSMLGTVWQALDEIVQAHDAHAVDCGQASRLRGLASGSAEMFEHGHAQRRRQIALDPFACDGDEERAAVVIPRSVAISRSACQNGSSRLMLVLCPDSTTDRFRAGLGIILRNVALLAVEPSARKTRPTFRSPEKTLSRRTPKADAILRERVEAPYGLVAPNSCRIFASSRSNSTGLVSNSSHPAASAFSRSPASA